jgi:RimJ/RimL family protein N-acetyltransferase
VFTTRRLNLVPMTPALADAERAGTTSLSVALRAEVPADWPPELYDDDDLERMRRLLDDPANQGWTLYYLIFRAHAQRLVGVAGFSGQPSTDHVVEIGYSVLRSEQRQGLATEAVGALLQFAFREPRVNAVVAETLPQLPESIRVLMHHGFRLSGETGRAGALRYCLPRATYEAGARRVEPGGLGTGRLSQP